MYDSRLQPPHYSPEKTCESLLTHAYCSHLFISVGGGEDFGLSRRQSHDVREPRRRSHHEGRPPRRSDPQEGKLGQSEQWGRSGGPSDWLHCRLTVGPCSATTEVGVYLLSNLVRIPNLQARCSVD